MPTSVTGDLLAASFEARTKSKSGDLLVGPSTILSFQCEGVANCDQACQAGENKRDRD